MATMRIAPQQQRQPPPPPPKSGGINVQLRLTDEQEEFLEKQFQKAKNPHPSELMLISAETGLLEEEVQAWFKQRMAMWRSDQGLNPISSRLC